MTPEQRRHFYFPVWNKCCQVNAWIMRDGRMVCDRQANEERSETHGKVWQAADKIADHFHRAVTPEDLRYACNALVNGGKTSSDQLKESWRVNHAVALFRVLIDPDDLKFMVAYLHPQLSERAGTIAYMLSLQEDSIWQQISLNAYGTRNWQSLPSQKHDWMIKQKKGAAPKVKPKPAHVLKPRFNINQLEALKGTVN